MDVGGEEGILLRVIGVLGDVPEGAAELVLAVFARDVTAVARDLGSRVGLTHDYLFITSLKPCFIMRI